MSISITGNSLYNTIGTNSGSTNKVEQLQNTLNATNTDTSEEELLEACKSFEAYFVEQMLTEMKKTVPTSEENEYTEYFGDMLYEEYAKEITDSGSIGLAKTLYESMKR